MPVPVVVHLQSSQLGRDITAEVRSLRMSSSAPGGYESLTLELARPFKSRGEDLAAFARVRLTDARHAGVVWDGYLADPGRGSGPDGQVWRITATGPSELFRRVNKPYLVIDSSLEGWARDGEPSATLSDAQVTLDDNPDLNSAAILMSVSQGTVIPAGGIAQAVYARMAGSSVLIGSVKYAYVAGVVNTNYRARLTVAGGVDAPEDVVSTQPTLSVVDVQKCAGTDWSLSHDLVLLGWDTNASHTATAETWVRFGRIVVRPAIRMKSGDPSAAITVFDQVLAHEVVEDLLGGGRLPGIDGANATVTVGTTPITQLVYVDGVTAYQVLDDLLTYESGMRWLCGAADRVTGLHSFEWAPWPTGDVRYEFDLASCNIDAPGSTSDLFNAVWVRWRDPFGATRTVYVAGTNPTLDDNDVVQETMLDLGDSLVSTEDEATAAGEKFLTERTWPSNGGTLTCGVPVLDRVTGRIVRPHEVVPGWLCSVRQIDNSYSTVSATDRNGVSVFRMVSTDYDSSSDTVAIGLDGWPRTVGQLLADLKNKPRRN